MGIAARRGKPARISGRHRACRDGRGHRGDDAVFQHVGGLIPAASAQGAAPAAASAAAKGPQYLKFPGKNEGLVVLGDRPLVAETPESLLDDDTTPIEKFYIRNNGQIPEETKDPDKWKITVDGEVEQHARDDARRAEREIQGGDAAHGAGMRRQRPFRLFAAGARQPVGQWRRGLRRMDRRAARRRAEDRRAEADREIHRALFGRPASLGRSRQAEPVARRAHREGDGCEHADRVGDERAAAAEHPWRPGAADRSRLDRLGVAEVADPHHHPRHASTTGRG